MMTGSVMAGRADGGLVGRTPGAGMLKAIVSAPGAALAQMIAWRSEPRPESSVLMTVVQDSTVAAALNSDVLPAVSVAVATILSPMARGTAGVNEGDVAAPACESV